jgi:2-hydroxychromene-2-carboxylate isomerase
MLFHYDFSSPYAYLAAHRIGSLLPDAQWQPIAFGPLVLQIGKVPWSWDEGPDRTAQMEDCERRAAVLGLPLRWPAGWPKATYSIAVLRAALVAEDHGLLRDFSLAAFDAGLGHGRDLSDLAVVLEVAETVGLARAAVEAGVADPAVKARLRDLTDAAIARGVTGVPTVVVGERLFWGDDRLEEAAAAAAQLA